jgi:enamine deaminase RidA (YjgF/YER057c/UK114 family)
VHVAGQLPIAPDGRKLSDAGFEDQARQVLANVEAALVGAGSRLDHLVQVRVYLTDIAHWPAFNTLYAAWLGPHRPARATEGPVTTITCSARAAQRGRRPHRAGAAPGLRSLRGRPQAGAWPCSPAAAATSAPAPT